MKKNWIRLLAVLLAAVMIFPATAFAAEPDYTLYADSKSNSKKTVSLKDEITMADGDEIEWISDDPSIVSVDNDGLVTAKSVGETYVEAKDKNTHEQKGVWTFKVINRSVVKLELVKGPTKTDYISHEYFDPTGIVLKATFDTDETEDNITSGYTYKTDPLSAADSKVTITYGTKTVDVAITVNEKYVTTIEIDKDPRINPSEYKVGDLISGIVVKVSFNDNSSINMVASSDMITLNKKGEKNRKLLVSDTSYEVTYEGKTDSKLISVKDNSSGGGGSGGGGSGETTGDYKAVIVYQPDKKDYKVGDKFDWTGTMIRIYKPDTNNNSVLYATLYGADLARYTDLEYTFKTADILGSGKTSIKCNFRVDGHKVEEFSITGLTVTAAKKTLDLSVKNHLISNIFVNMKRTAYPVGSTIALSDIEYIGGKDDNNSTVMLSPSDLSDYANTFSLEVLSVDRNGNTTRKSAAYKNKIESGDVYTNRYDDKVVYLRFYVDDDYLDFTVESGDSGVYVYYGSTLLGIYSELAKALEDVNDLDFKWGSSETKYSDTRKLTIKLGEDMKLGRYDGQIALNRDIDIDLNGHKLTVYSDVFVFLDKKIDVFKATIGNTATETGTLIYDNMPYDDLLIDKGESIVFQYTDDKNADLPGIYTLTVEEPKNGAVASNPGLSRENKVTVSHGHDATFTVTPDANYEIESVKVKSGNSSTATTVSSTTNTGYSVNSSGVATYTMKDVKGVATVTATFKAAKAEKPADTWENPFKDISSYASYFDAVKYVSQNGLMQGDDLGNFNPSQTMTRAQFVTTLGRMYLGTIYSTVAEKDAAMIRTYGTDSQFTDVSYSDGRISYAVPYIKWAESNGLVQGYGNGKFGPYDTITHQQMYIIMYRYAQSLAMKSINVSSVTLRASDADELGAGWLAAAKEGAIAAAKYAQQQNFLVSTTRIDPNGNALRYELATLLMQFSKNVLGRE